MELLIDKPFQSLLIDLLNYSILLSIFYIIYKKKIITKKDFLIYCVFSVSPFFFNDIIIPYSLFWDQQKYIYLSDEIRHGWLNFSFIPNTTIETKVLVSSYIFSLFPIFSFSNINSIAFVSKGIYCLTLIYLSSEKKLPISLKIIFLISPSVLLYSSVSLRDILVLSLMLLSVHLILKDRNFFLGLLTLIILTIIKIQNGLICLASILLFIIFINVYKSRILFFLVSMIIMSVIIFIIFGNHIFEQFNFFRRGLYLEEYGAYKDIIAPKYYDTKLLLGYDYYTLKVAINNFINFIFAPSFSVRNIFHLISALEAFFIFVYLIIFFYSYFDKNKNQTIFWVSIMFVSFLFYSQLAFNDNTIARYRFPLVIFFLYSTFLTSGIRKK